MSAPDSEARWDGSASRYTDAEYAKACVLDRGDCMDASQMSAKQRYSLPVANPGSSWSANPDAGGVAAAAGRLSGTSAGAACKRAAAKRLVRAYNKLGNPPPDSVKTLAGMSANSRPPRDGLVRMRGDLELRDSSNGAGPSLVGHFAVYDAWTEISSVVEGNFMERIAPGAFAKTFAEGSDKIKVTFQHGHDPLLGDKPLGSITSLREDEIGAAYEVSLFEGIPPLVMSGLRAGEYGSSFRFRVTREDIVNDAESSDHNPQGLPERTIKEAEVFEFGPVTYPAYEGATAGVRSVTDDYIFEQFQADPERFATLLETFHRAEEESHPEEEDNDRAEEAPHPVYKPRLQGRITLDKEASKWKLP